MTARSTCTVDLGAVAANVGLLLETAAGAELCAVVKANAYGHGVVPVAETALAAGAACLAVAQVDEAEPLRAAGIDAPIWLLSEPAANQWADVARLGIEPTVYRADSIDAAAAARVGALHLKVDTGMGRVGTDAETVIELARLAADRGVRVAGTTSHLAVADAPDRPETAEQVARFDAVLDAFAEEGLDPGLRHLANSAATLTGVGPYDVVRCGITLHGLPPDPAVAPPGLRPSLRWTSSVSFVKRVAAGTPVSYGHRAAPPDDTTVATVPVGYADGLPRAAWRTGRVLIGGAERPILGMVTMDQILVDVGDDPVDIGDEVVLVGRQGEAERTVADWAADADTITYEITCGLGLRAEWRWIGGAS